MLIAMEFPLSALLAPPPGLKIQEWSVLSVNMQAYSRTIYQECVVCTNVYVSEVDSRGFSVIVPFSTQTEVQLSHPSTSMITTGSHTNESQASVRYFQCLSALLRN